jgi:sulfur-oxidizing protein SoxY
MFGHALKCLGSQWSWLCFAALGLALLSASTGLSSAATPEAEDTWASLANDIFGGRPLADGTGLVSIDMPTRAEDAAIVPVTMRLTLPPDDLRRLKALTLVIDNNPVPVAATFTFSDGAGVSVISTRVRINSYTNVHVVAELSDSKLYLAQTYVKASGGCSAPAAKNADEAIATLGQMRFRVFGKPSGAQREAQVMIRHPNNSGLQRDQVSLLYIPANFVDELHVWQGHALLFSMKSGISISEDPNFRFTYVPNGATTFKVEARDTQGKVFVSEWPATASEPANDSSNL